MFKEYQNNSLLSALKKLKIKMDFLHSRSKGPFLNGRARKEMVH